MRNVKFVSLFAACGFVLSFVFGLFSHSSFLSILLKALLFSVIFVCLGLLISFVYTKFLADPNYEDGVGDFSDLASKGSGEGPKAGQNVDIVVQDEELPEGDTDNHFVVGDNHQMLKTTDIREDNSSSAIDVGTAEPQFVPLRKVENQNNFSGTESVTSAEATPSDETVEQLEEDIDTLPDMESLSAAQEGETGESNNDSFSFSDLNSSASSYKKSDGSVPDVKDAGLIAKAISTALAEDDS